MSSSMVIHSDCSHFRGDVPCTPHKELGVHCDGCPQYDKISGRILIIKLAATGDVIRTTPLLSALQERYPEREIWWLTQSVDVLPECVHKRMAFTLENVLAIQATSFDVAINLDKDPHACAIMASVTAQTRFGYTWKNGRPHPVDDRAIPKFLTGLFDDVNQKNTLSYPEEIYAICNLPYAKQEYVIDDPGPAPCSLPSGSGPLIGLNTGCGNRWVAREWPLTSWEELVLILTARGCRVVLLGGPAEHVRNESIATSTGAYYPGTFSIKKFFALVNACDAVVTTVTMGLHAAIGLRKHVVLMNNIFNPHEFELYGRGVLLQPDKPCTCYFKHACTNPDYQCMEYLAVERVANAVTDYL